MYQQNISVNSVLQKSDIKNQYKQAEILRERIDDELYHLSKANEEEDTRQIRNTINSNLTAMSFICSEMIESLQQENESEQIHWKSFVFAIK